MCCRIGESSGEGAILRIRRYHERSCTDLIVLFGLLAFAGLTVYIAYYAIANGGDPNRILRGVDMYGNICGKSTATKDQPYAAWPYPLYYSPQICVASCAETETDTARMAVRYPSKAYSKFCLPDVTTTAGAALTLSPEFSTASKVLGRAVGDVSLAAPIIAGCLVLALFISYLYTYFLRVVANILVYGLIFGFILAGAVGGWTLLQKAEDQAKSAVSKDADYLRGAAYLVIALTLIFTCVVLFLRNQISIAVEVVKEASRAFERMPMLALFPLVPFFMFICYAIFWVIVAMYIYSVADTKMESTPVEVQYNLATGARNSNPSEMSVLAWNDRFMQTFAAHFFGLLWNAQFFLYLSYMVCAGAVADWYFTPRDAPNAASNDDNPNANRSIEMAVRSSSKRNRPGEEKKDESTSAWASPKNANSSTVVPIGADGKLPELTFSSTPIYDSFKRTLRFHIGTVAFGALILAIINFIRAVIKYIEMQTKEKNNSVQKAIFCMIQCCLTCLECCCDKLSRQALIWTAIWGDPFPVAACESFKLIWRNLGRTAAVSMVSSYLLIIGKMFVALLSTMVAGVILTRSEPYKTDLSQPFIPCLLVLVLSYAIASVFFSSVDTTIDTVFLCFLVDSELNGDKGRPMLASEGLTSLVNSYSMQSAELARKVKEGHDGAAAPAPVPVQAAPAQ